MSREVYPTHGWAVPTPKISGTIAAKKGKKKKKKTTTQVVETIFNQRGWGEKKK